MRPPTLLRSASLSLSIALVSLLAGCSSNSSVNGDNDDNDDNGDPSMPGQPAQPDAGVSTCTDCAPHELLLDELVGFGAGTTGGKGGTLYTVTSLASSGPGTLREALTDDAPTWIRFGVSGTIELTSPIELASNKTVDGRGADITIVGNGLYITGESNVIINNIKIRDTSNDAIRVYNGAHHVWVHHVDVSNGGDGAIDVTEGTTDVTVSWTHIFDHDKAMLIGAGSDDGDGESLRWTAHHNWYDWVIQRLPMLRQGKAHSFNNLVEWMGGHAMSARVAPAQLFSENDILAPQSGVDHKVVTIESGASVKYRGTWEKPYSSTLNILEANPENVFDPSDFYSYTAETADADLEARIRAGAGWQDVPFPE